MRNWIIISSVCMLASQTALADPEYVDRARVLSVVPQVQQVNQPRQDCRTDYVRESVYEPANRSNTGAVVGGVAGGLLGSTIGRGTGRIAAAAVGAGLGAIVGDRVDNQNSVGQARVITRPVEQCVMIDQWQTVTTGYLVNYEYQGRQYSTVMDRDPGQQIEVSVMVRPNGGLPPAVGYQTPYPPTVYQPATYPGRGYGRRQRDYW